MLFFSHFLPVLLVVVLQVYPGQSQGEPSIFYGRRIFYFPTPKTTFEAFVDCRVRDLNMLTLTTYDEFIRLHGHTMSIHPEGILVSPITISGSARRWLATGELDTVFGHGYEPLTCFHLHSRGLVDMDCNEKFPYYCV